MFFFKKKQTIKGISSKTTDLTYMFASIPLKSHQVESEGIIKA